MQAAFAFALRSLARSLALRTGAVARRPGPAPQGRASDRACAVDALWGKCHGSGAVRVHSGTRLRNIPGHAGRPATAGDGRPGAYRSDGGAAFANYGGDARLLG